jgi:hypothetical protein
MRWKEETAMAGADTARKEWEDEMENTYRKRRKREN